MAEKTPVLYGLTIDSSPKGDVGAAPPAEAAAQNTEVLLLVIVSSVKGGVRRTKFLGEVCLPSVLVLKIELRGLLMFCRQSSSLQNIKRSQSSIFKTETAGRLTSPRKSIPRTPPLKRSKVQRFARSIVLSRAGQSFLLHYTLFAVGTTYPEVVKKNADSL